jgi:hypothetical protein
MGSLITMWKDHLMGPVTMGHPNPLYDRASEAVAHAQNLGKTMANFGEDPTTVIAKELAVFTQAEIAKAKLEWDRSHATAEEASELYAQQQEQLDQLFTQASGFRGVGSMAAILPDGKQIKGQADADGIRMIALSMGLKDPALSSKFKKQNNERNGVFDAPF